MTFSERRKRLKFRLHRENKDRDHSININHEKNLSMGLNTKEKFLRGMFSKRFYSLPDAMS